VGVVGEQAFCGRRLDLSIRYLTREKHQTFLLPWAPVSNTTQLFRFLNELKELEQRADRRIVEQGHPTPMYGVRLILRHAIIQSELIC